MTFSRGRTGVVALALTALLTACTGSRPDEPPGPPTSPTIADSAPATTTTTSTSVPEQSGRQTVVIEGFAFSPAELTVSAGTTVVWTNNDTSRHTVVGDDDLSSPDLGRGASYEHTFTTPGTYAYACGIHPRMRGTVTVTR